MYSRSIKFLKELFIAKTHQHGPSGGSTFTLGNKTFIKIIKKKEVKIANLCLALDFVVRNVTVAVFRKDMSTSRDGSLNLHTTALRYFPQLLGCNQTVNIIFSGHHAAVAITNKSLIYQGLTYQ